MERIANLVLTEECSERIRLLGLRLLRVLVANEFLPADDGAIKLDVFFTLLLRGNRLFVVDEEKHDRLSSHQMLLHLGEVRGVTMFVEQVQNLLSSQDFLDLVEHFEVILSELVVDGLKSNQRMQQQMQLKNHVWV